MGWNSHLQYILPCLTCLYLRNLSATKKVQPRHMKPGVSHTKLHPQKMKSPTQQRNSFHKSNNLDKSYVATVCKWKYETMNFHVSFSPFESVYLSVGLSIYMCLSTICPSVHPSICPSYILAAFSASIYKYDSYYIYIQTHMYQCIPPPQKYSLRVMPTLIHYSDIVSDMLYGSHSF